MRWRGYLAIMSVVMAFSLVVGGSVGVASGARRDSDVPVRMTFERALMVAVAYWKARGIETPCHPVPVRVSRERLVSIYGVKFGSRVYMYSDVAACRVGLSSMAVADRYWMPSYFCSAVVHELGHIDGLSHAYGGVMRTDGLGHIPWGCRRPRRWWRANRADFDHWTRFP